MPTSSFQRCYDYLYLGIDIANAFLTGFTYYQLYSSSQLQQQNWTTKCLFWFGPALFGISFIVNPFIASQQLQYMITNSKRKNKLWSPIRYLHQCLPLEKPGVQPAMEVARSLFVFCLPIAVTPFLPIFSYHVTSVTCFDDEGNFDESMETYVDENDGMQGTVTELYVDWSLKKRLSLLRGESDHSYSSQRPPSLIDKDAKKLYNAVADSWWTKILQACDDISVFSFKYTGAAWNSVLIALPNLVLQSSLFFLFSNNAVGENTNSNLDEVAASERSSSFMLSPLQMASLALSSLQLVMTVARNFRNFNVIGGTVAKTCFVATDIFMTCYCVSAMMREYSSTLSTTSTINNSNSYFTIIRTFLSSHLFRFDSATSIFITGKLMMLLIDYINIAHILFLEFKLQNYTIDMGSAVPAVIVCSLFSFPAHITRSFIKSFTGFALVHATMMHCRRDWKCRRADENNFFVCQALLKEYLFSSFASDKPLKKESKETPNGVVIINWNATFKNIQSHLSMLCSPYQFGPSSANNTSTPAIQSAKNKKKKQLKYDKSLAEILSTTTPMDLLEKCAVYHYQESDYNKIALQDTSLRRCYHLVMMSRVSLLLNHCRFILTTLHDESFVSTSSTNSAAAASSSTPNNARTLNQLFGVQNTIFFLENSKQFFANAETSRLQQQQNTTTNNGTEHSGVFALHRAHRFTENLLEQENKLFPETKSSSLLEVLKLIYKSADATLPGNSPVESDRGNNNRTTIEEHDRKQRMFQFRLAFIILSTTISTLSEFWILFVMNQNHSSPSSSSQQQQLSSSSVSSPLLLLNKFFFGASIVSLFGACLSFPEFLKCYIASAVDSQYVCCVFSGRLPIDIDLFHYSLLIHSAESYLKLPRVKQILRNEEEQLVMPEDAFEQNVLPFLRREFILE